MLDSLYLVFEILNLGSSTFGSRASCMLYPQCSVQRAHSEQKNFRGMFPIWKMPRPDSDFQGFSGLGNITEIYIV